MDYLAGGPQFNTLSLPDLLKARDQFHPHLMHKANVVGTAIGRYLIRKADPYPTGRDEAPRKGKKKQKPPRTLENSEVRDYSWPCVLVFVKEWVEEEEFRAEGRFSPSDFLPKTIYLEDGQSVPICTVLAPLVETAPPPLDPKSLTFPDKTLAGGFPIMSTVQGEQHFASIGCLLTDGHKLYALTNRHVAGEPGEILKTKAGGRSVSIGRSSKKQISRMPFEQVYQTWPGKRIYVNLDVGLVELDDKRKWSPAINGVGQVGPLADLSIYNLTLNLIGCPVRAFGCASGRLYGRISALFYRYKSVGGFEYVADFLIGSRDSRPLMTRPGDSGSVWVVESDDLERDLSPIAVQWGGAVFSGSEENFPFALATNLSNVCRELEVELYRSRELASFEYWESVGHYSIGSFACQLPSKKKLNKLMRANQANVGFETSKINKSVNRVRLPAFVPLANVPDKVWKKNYDKQKTPYGRKGQGGSEGPNHYSDIDYPPGGAKTLDDLTPAAASLDAQTWRDFYKKVGWNAVSKRGLLPFRVWQIYKAMVTYISKGNVEYFVAAAGVLAHYVGDSCQPLHGSYLTHGDPFRNPDGSPSAKELGLGEGYAGEIHGVYEGEMLDENVKPLIDGLTNALGQQGHGMKLVKGGQEAGFAIIELIRRTHKRLKPMAIVEAYGKLVLAGDEAKAPAELWKKFGPKTIEAIADGCRTLAMLWDSAWAEGGGDKVADSALVEITEKKLKDIYMKDRDFIPSVALGQIDKYL